MAIGLGASLIGQDPLTGSARLTFGFVRLLGGVDFISVIVGLFAISEVMINVEQRITAISEFEIGKLDADLGRYQSSAGGRCFAVRGSVSCWDSSPDAPRR